MHMKRLALLFLISFLCISAFSQDIQQDTVKKESWFQRVFGRRTEVVHDTVYLFVNDYIDDEEDDIEEEDDELMEKAEYSGIIPLPFDTIDTDDKFQKVVLFDNGTWIYLEIPKPDIPDFISNDHWMTSSVHAYTDISIKDLPEELTLTLCDSTHGWHIPGEGQVVSSAIPSTQPLTASSEQPCPPDIPEAMATSSCCVMPMDWRPITDT